MVQVLAVDFEWYIDTGTFRSAAWQVLDKPGQPIEATSDFAAAKYFLGEMAFENPDLMLVGHNINSDLRQMVKWGIPLPARFKVADSMLAARLVFPSIPEKKLKPLAREFGLDYADKHNTEDLNELLEYNSKDVYASQQVYTDIWGMASQDQRTLIDLNNQFSQAFLACEVAGVCMDLDYLEQEVERLSSDLSESLEKVPLDVVTNDGVFRDWILSQYTQEDLKELPRTTETREIQLNENSLRMLPRRVEGLDDIVQARSTYDRLRLYVFNPLEKQDQGFYPAAYNLLLAKTHRRSTEPAVQNWPVEARRAFRPRYPEGKLIALDMKNLEARIFAWQAGSKAYMDTLVEGGYMLVAEKAFGWTGLTKKDPRYIIVKSIILAIMYNRTPYGCLMDMKQKLGLEETIDNVEGYYKTFFTAYPEIYRHIEDRKAYMHRTGYAWPVVGESIQPLSDISAHLIQGNEARRRNKSWENKAVNNPTQMLAAYVTGCALVDLNKGLMDWHGLGWNEWLHRLHMSRIDTDGHGVNLQGFPIMEVHDELVLEATSIDHVQDLIDCATYYMTNPQTLKRVSPDFAVPLEVEVAVGDYLSKA